MEPAAFDPFGTLARIEARLSAARHVKKPTRYYDVPGAPPAQEHPRLTAAKAVQRLQAAPRRILHPEAAAVVAAVCAAYNVFPGKILYLERGPTSSHCRAATYRLLKLRYRWTTARIVEEFARERSGVDKALVKASALWTARGQWRRNYHAAEAALEAAK